MRWIGVTLLGARLLGDVISNTDPFVTIANYGILGLLAIAFFTGRIVSVNQYNQAVADRDREHGELVALRVKTEDQFIPAIVKSTEMMSKFIDRMPR